MMSVRGSDGNESAGGSNNGGLLRDIEEISRALYLPKAPSKALVSTSDVRSKSVGRTRFLESKSKQKGRVFDESLSSKEKKSLSLWNWKNPLKALTHMVHYQYDVCFLLHVHSLEGLPDNFNHLSLFVQWKRKNHVFRTRASMALDGVAEFEETLMLKCSVYGSRSGSQNSVKYAEKLCLINCSVVEAPGLDIGKHSVNLTRLLPLTFEELEGENNSGKWTTSFKLTGKAKGAVLNVSFGFFLEKANLVESRGKLDGGPSNENSMLQHFESVKSNLNHLSLLSSPSADINFAHEVFPLMGMELSKSITFLYQKLNEGSLNGSSRSDRSSEQEEQPKTSNDVTLKSDEVLNEGVDFVVEEQGIEKCQEDQRKSEENAVDGSIIETINVDDIFKDCDTDVDKESEQGSEVGHCGSFAEYIVADDCKQDESAICTDLSTAKDVDSAIHNIMISDIADLDDFLAREEYLEAESNYKCSNVLKKSLSFDDIDTVATDFLNMLEIERDDLASACDSTPESPRERLLREFENESLASGNFILDTVGEELSITTPSFYLDDISEDSISFPVTSDSEGRKTEKQRLKDRRKVKMLEDLETEALMHEWGLNEKAFQRSPYICSDGFGSPIELPKEDPGECTNAVGGYHWEDDATNSSAN